MKNNFKKGNINTILFIKHVNDDIIIVQIYVDDIVFGSTNEHLCDNFSNIIKSEFELLMMGELNFFLEL